jgi:hypothetical protein
MSRSVLACLFSNGLYAAAAIWYAYITHLGYRGKCFVLCSAVKLWDSDDADHFGAFPELKLSETLQIEF